MLRSFMAISPAMNLDQYRAEVERLAARRDAEPERLCRRPDCDHTAGAHSPVLLMQCTESDCDCLGFLWEPE